MKFHQNHLRGQGGYLRGKTKAERAIGLAALPNGGFVFTDAQNNHAQIVPPEALSTLFKR
jgi:hypothetical protein